MVHLWYRFRVNGVLLYVTHLSVLHENEAGA